MSKKEIGRCFKLILKALETSVELITTGDFMSRFCSNLALSTAVQKAATHIARKAVEMDIVAGRSPISVAAAAIYMASQVRRNPLKLSLGRINFPTSDHATQSDCVECLSSGSAAIEKLNCDIFIQGVCREEVSERDR